MKIVAAVAVLTLMLVGTGAYYVWELISIGVAYKAKVLCSGVFVSKRPPDDVLNSDLAVDDLAILHPIDAVIDRTTQAALATFLGLIKQSAEYRPGIGCTLRFNGYEQRAPAQLDVAINALDMSENGWPADHSKTDVAEHMDQDLLDAALDWAFSEPDPEHLRRTRAVVVIHRGQIVGERYAPLFNQNTPLIGWSMTKSVVHALVGVLIQEGKLSLADRVQAPEWQEPDDGRSTITVAHLLQMTSGIEFDEDYANPLADVTYMLLRTPDMAGYAASKR